jgi:transposase
MEIKILHRQGNSIRAIARRLKLSRNSVRRYLRQTEDTPKVAIRAKQRSKLAPYHDYLQDRLQAAHPEWLPAPVLFREICELGYAGKLRRLQSYLSTCKAQEPVTEIRFETPPGHQLQIDWIEFRQQPSRLSAFVATLGYSRASFVEFVENEQLDTLLRCHENAFDYFGGVPQETLYDNIKTVVVERNAYAKGQHRFQPTFWDFAHHYGFIPRLCRPYRAQTKGKVERFNRYLRHSFYNPLASRLKPLGLLVDVALANVEVKYWLQTVAHQRVHATTAQTPAVRLAFEQSYLQTLPPPYTGKRCPPSKVPTQDHRTLQHDVSLYDGLLQGGYSYDAK